VRSAGRTPDLEILAVETGSFDPPGPDGAFTDGLTKCLSRALRRSGLTAADVSLVLPATNGMARLDDAENAAIATVLGTDVPRLCVKEITGEAFSASGAFQLAALLARHRDDSTMDGRYSVITARSVDGAAGAAVVRGWSRAGRDHG
jgi:3-oxoacyl-[acyl-carrier-protein] synthase II